MPKGCLDMLVLIQVFALLAALTAGGSKHVPIAGPVAYDIIMPSGG
ncbi:MAG: hypothetical protein QOJ39_2494 [Candidatus Eremiobacteraeota bacterium]|nr:hypothetical protein [Candidatus Eremiobacteraeota bacterium]